LSTHSIIIIIIDDSLRSKSNTTNKSNNERYLLSEILSDVLASVHYRSSSRRSAHSCTTNRRCVRVQIPRESKTYV